MPELTTRPPASLTWPIQVGDLVVYFEIDSFLPKISRFWEFFTEPSETEVFRVKEGFRVRSIRHRKFLSQGLVFPLGDFPEINIPYEQRICSVGRTVATSELLSTSFAQLLGVEKWEFTDTAPNLPNLGRPPDFISMPGWHRIQDIERVIFARHNRKILWQITEKLDGVTMTVYKFAKDSHWATHVPALPADCPPSMQNEKSRYGVCGRLMDMIDREDNVYWQAARKSGILDKLRQVDMPNVAVQGELCGASIEGNTMKYPEGAHEFLAFSVWDIDRAGYLLPRDAAEWCEKHGIKYVPIVAYTTMGKFAHDVHDLLNKAEGQSKFGGVREGFVFKSVDGRMNFKVISNGWLTETGK
ncbi:RNA ligase-domain-containing protein [Staphylotrichum tortipilum]|uniref:RNA ligase-domain-containing protein n=1 Tax=Staphylotrichum tortipilum TaxID=2831512 RepID=A0AAN6MPK4_9PEZI|nr:RNA ligase-domain-containing protein [Staphylotrichum longicolle]